MKPSIPAAYEPGRQADGKFAKGNSISRGWAGETAKRFQQQRALWFDAISAEDMEAVKREILSIGLTCPVWDVKLKALVYFADRTWGKPTERVEIESENGVRQMVVDFDLSPEEVKVLERVVGRAAAADQVIDVAAIPQDDSTI